MDIIYQTNEKQLASIKKISAEAANIIVYQYQDVFRDFCYIFKSIFKISSFTAELLYKDECYNVVIESIFNIKTQIGDFQLYLGEKRFKISNKEASWCFNVQPFYPQDEIHLAEYIKDSKEKVLIERFSYHKMELEVHFKKSGKVFFIEIPIEKPYFLDLRYFSSLKEKCDIKDIIRFYRKMFYEDQSNFDRNENTTSIGIYQKTDDFGNYNKKGIKLDEVLLRNGLIYSCQLGSIRYNSDDEPIIMTLKDGTYTITGYQSKNNETLDINEAIMLLERRKQGLDE